MPEAWFISRLCEEFGCTPLQVVEDLENDPERWMLRILPLRALARAYQSYKAAQSKKELGKAIHQDPWVRRVVEIDFAEKRRQIEANKQGGDEDDSDRGARGDPAAAG